jgi:uncharacterized iron-regulated membrane protein
MPHEFRNLPNASHETLTNALIAGAVAALVMFALICYLLWRDRKKFKKGKAVRGSPRRVRKKRPR